ncbi:hypothetical protein D3C87_1795710 [compost metagenome]
MRPPRATCPPANSGGKLDALMPDPATVMLGSSVAAPPSAWGSFCKEYAPAPCSATA